MNDNEKLAEWIDRFTNNELEGEDLRKFIGLLRSDPELRKEVKLDHDLNTILLDEDILDLRKKFMARNDKKARKRIDPGQLLLAASLLFLAGIGFLIYFTAFKNNRMFSRDKALQVAQDSILAYYARTDDRTLIKLSAKDSLVLLKTTPSGNTRPGDNELAVNYRPFPAFEILVGSAMRSSGFNLTYPVRFSFKRETPVRFQWVSRVKLFLSLKIMDNKGNPVMDMEPGYAGNCRITNTLSPGLYYYKFLADGEIIYFGKFTIE